LIRAAGAVLWRERRPFELEIALVHRTKYDDWTLPKGHVEEGESPISAAYREVLEQTGFKSHFGPYLGSVDYEMESGTKSVKYWMAHAIEGSKDFIPNNEIDRMEWVNLRQAKHFLTYDNDREVLKLFRGHERHGNTIVLLRHCKAIKRIDWDGDDSDRPLAIEGQQTAQKLIAHLKMFNLDEVHSSDAYRCISSIDPLCEKLELEKVVTDQLSEYLFERDDLIAADYVRRLIKFGGNYLICSHNPILPIILDRLVKNPEHYEIDRDLNPSDAWIVHHRGGKVFAVDFLKSPVV